MCPLGIAISESRTQLAKELIDAEICDLRTGYGGYGSALHLAVERTNLELVKKLLEKDLSLLSCINNVFETPLHAAFETLKNHSL